jgi:hypothetical protein
MTAIHIDPDKDYGNPNFWKSSPLCTVSWKKR